MTESVAAADTAWILASFTAVSLMIVGLALFYGGMVGVRHTLNMMMMVLGSSALIGVLWIAVGYSAVLGDSVGGLGLIGNPLEHAGLRTIMEAPAEPGLPPALVAGFQLLFASITVALIAGALAERVKFAGWMLFAGLWAVFVYFPVAHWVFAFDSEDGSVLGGWIANDLGAIDFAGGTAVHINAGVAALAVVLVVGRRRLFPQVSRPHSLPLTVLGAGILFFGWFGFNGGSALAAGNTAGVVVLNTVAAAMAASLTWMLVEKIVDTKATTLGAASGIIAGLVAITPACGAVEPLGALAIGAISSLACFYAISLKFRLGYDDSLDVVGLHLVAGVIGTILIGFLANPAAPNEGTGLFYGGGFALLGIQTVAVLAVLAYTMVVTMILAWIVDKTLGLRADPEHEHEGLDVTVHGETAYVQDSFPMSSARSHSVDPTSQPVLRVEDEDPAMRGKTPSAETAGGPTPAGPTVDESAPAPR